MARPIRLWVVYTTRSRVGRWGSGMTARPGVTCKKPWRSTLMALMPIIFSGIFCWIRMSRSGRGCTWKKYCRRQAGRVVSWQMTVAAARPHSFSGNAEQTPCRGPERVPVPGVMHRAYRLYKKTEFHLIYRFSISLDQIIDIGDIKGEYHDPAYRSAFLRRTHQYLQLRGA